MFSAPETIASPSPNSDYQRTAVETKDPNWLIARPYNLKIYNVRFYAALGKITIPDSVRNIEFNEMKIFPKQYSGTLQFTVPGTTYALSVFIQDPLAGYDPRIPPSMFKLLDNSDLYLNTLSINYGGVNKPDSKWDSLYIPAVTAAGVITVAPTMQLQQRYHDTYEESGLDVELAGAESFTDYLRRGPFYHYVYKLDAANRATQVTINSTFKFPGNTPASIDACKLILVAHYKSPVSITTKDGIIRDVRNRTG
jgi:hypothetical protein